ECPRFHLVEAAGGERRADQSAHRAAGDQIGLGARLGESTHLSDVPPAARGAGAEGEADLGPARHYCIRAHRSWASDLCTLTRNLSPGATLTVPSTCTTPSI